jgi:hypothetical protein
MTEVISAPGDLIVATSDGVDVRFAGLELTADVPGHVQVQPGERAIKINLEAIRCLVTAQRDQIYNEAMLEWVERRKSQGAESAGPVPIMPGVLAFEPVDLQITDDCGTDYRFVSGQAAGDGTEWSASRTYLPEPPRQANILSLVFMLHGSPTGKSCKIQID